MCILFKKKIKLEKNTDIMSSKINKNIKEDTKIIIPENYVGIFYYKDKFLFSLNTGEYKLTDPALNKILDKNLKRNKKNKKPNYNFNVHFVNIKELNFNMELKALTSLKEKAQYSFSANYTINNPEKFATELLTTWYKTTNKRTINYINNWFKEFCNLALKKHHKQALNNAFLTDKANSYFKKYGIKINQATLTNASSNFFAVQENIVNNKLTNKNEQQINIGKFCPHCQYKILDGAEFCLNCGKKLKENNLLNNFSIDKY